jgi:hypothetical protein
MEQALYLLMLELFDLLKEEQLFIDYKVKENELLNDYEFISLVNDYHNNDFNKDECFMNINNNLNYQAYLKLYELCNERLKQLSDIIFKDICGDNNEY